MNLNNVDLRQFTILAGRVLIAVGLAIFFFNINVGIQMLQHPGLEIAVAGFLLKAV